MLNISSSHMLDDLNETPLLIIFHFHTLFRPLYYILQVEILYWQFFLSHPVPLLDYNFFMKAITKSILIINVHPAPSRIWPHNDAFITCCMNEWIYACHDLANGSNLLLINFSLVLTFLKISFCQALILLIAGIFQNFHH
jgi:hypothetical protein